MSCCRTTIRVTSATLRSLPTPLSGSHTNILPHIIREKRRSIVPQVLFEDTMELQLRGIRVVLIYLGPTHSDNMICVHVPAEGVLFAPDFARDGTSCPTSAISTFTMR